MCMESQLRWSDTLPRGLIGPASTLLPQLHPGFSVSEADPVFSGQDACWASAKRILDEVA